MNKLNKWSSFVILLAITGLFSGCSDQFLQDKQNYDNFTAEIYNDILGAQGRVNFLYYSLLPSSTA